MTERPGNGPIDAVTVDLDDTLYPQASWLDGAWQAVATRAAAAGLPREDLLAALRAVSGEGSDRGNILDRALRRIGASDHPIQPLLEAFRGHAPDRLPWYPGACEALAALHQIVPVAVISDGDPAGQRAKLRALGIRTGPGGLVDHIVLSDEIGRRFRKPHPAPFRRALAQLGCGARTAVHVGDRPTKDVAGPQDLGMRAVRVLTGEYASVPADVGDPWRIAPDAASALHWLALLAGSRAGRAGNRAGNRADTDGVWDSSACTGTLVHWSRFTPPLAAARVDDPVP
jgi:putative hydrolase of the HAD superfamily